MSAAHLLKVVVRSAALLAQTLALLAQTLALLAQTLALLAQTLALLPSPKVCCYESSYKFLARCQR